MLRGKPTRRVGVVLGTFVVALVSLMVIATPAVAQGTYLGGHIYRMGTHSYVRGHIEYEQWGGHRDFHMDMWDMRWMHGGTVAVFVAGHRMGAMHVGYDGHCGMHRDSAHGQYVPILHAGDVVKIRGPNGNVVASGTLHRMMMGMM